MNRFRVNDIRLPRIALSLMIVSTAISVVSAFSLALASLPYRTIEASDTSPVRVLPCSVQNGQAGLVDVSPTRAARASSIKKLQRIIGAITRSPRAGATRDGLAM